jgi:hypothetical protein
VPPVAKLDLRNAYARNVFYDVGKSFGVFEPSGRWHATLPAFRDALESYQPLAATFTIYIDGKQNASGPGLGADASLANDANLYVGGAPQGHNLDGAIEFMRIARGTLADAKTTINELYAWEFNGPFLHDFTGRARPDDGGEAGAMSLTDIRSLESRRASTSNHIGRASHAQAAQTSCGNGCTHGAR